jgi:hypothetical protein
VQTTRARRLALNVSSVAVYRPLRVQPECACVMRRVRKYLTGPSRLEGGGPRVVFPHSAGAACLVLANETWRAVARVCTVRPHSRRHRTRESGAVADATVCYSRNVRKTHRCPFAVPVARPSRPPGRSYIQPAVLVRSCLARSGIPPVSEPFSLTPHSVTIKMRDCILFRIVVSHCMFYSLVPLVNPEFIPALLISASRSRILVVYVVGDTKQCWTQSSPCRSRSA